MSPCDSESSGLSLEFTPGTASESCDDFTLIADGRGPDAVPDISLQTWPRNQSKRWAGIAAALVALTSLGVVLAVVGPQLLSHSIRRSTATGPRTARDPVTTAGGSRSSTADADFENCTTQDVMSAQSEVPVETASSHDNRPSETTPIDLTSDEPRSVDASKPSFFFEVGRNSENQNKSADTPNALPQDSSVVQKVDAEQIIEQSQRTAEVTLEEKLAKSTPSADPTAASKAFYIGVEHYWSGRHTQAAEAFEKAVSLHRINAVYHYFLALTYRQLGDNRAEASLETAVTLERKFPPQNLGTTMERVQGPVRNWMENARRKAKVGPYTERENARVRH